jgi:RNA polymerase sigma-70 factor (ECF subfamily)
MDAPKRARDIGAEDAMSGHLRAIADRGDRQAFEAVFIHFAPRIKAYLMRLGGDAVTAEEVTQETMVMVWRKAALYDPAKASPATWIFTIARNQRIDAFRRERHPEIDPEDPALRIDDDPAADTVLETKQSSAEVSRAIAELATSERQLLTLAYYEDKSHTMISAELGIPLGTVKSRMRQVFRKLRSHLAPELGEGP